MNLLSKPELFEMFIVFGSDVALVIKGIRMN